MVYDRIYNVTRYKVAGHGGRYTYAFNQAVDNRPKKTVQNSEIGIRLISPDYYGENGGKVDDGTMSMLSAHNSEAVLVLPSDKRGYLKDLRNSLKIDDYIRNVADPKKGKSTTIRSIKMQESAQARESALSSLKEAIGEAQVFVNGNKITDITTHDASSRMNEALGRLVDNFYYKLQYMRSPKDDVDIREMFKKDAQMKIQLTETEDPNALALKEVKNVISLSSGAHNMISMKSIIDQFVKNPYGYTESDIRYLVARLFKDGDLSVTVDKEPITMFNRTPDDLGSYFTNRKYLDKMLLMVKETISGAKMKACKLICHELFLVTENTDDADKLMAHFVDRASNLLENCKDMQNEHDRISVQYPKYSFPGEKTLKDAIKLLTDVLSVRDTALFFNKISEYKESLLDMAEEIHPVKTFYSTESQKKIFCESGLRALKFYDSSKEHIVDEKLEKIIEEIRAIVNNKKPYRKIKDLPELYSKFIELYDAILNEKLVPVKQIIEQDKLKVLNKLNGKEYEAEFRTQVIQDFRDLEDRADRTADISDMLGFKDKADSRCVTWLNKIAQKESFYKPTGFQAHSEELQNRNDGTDERQYVFSVPPVAKLKEQRTVIARSITSDWIIESEEDLDEYMDTLKRQILALMDDEHSVMITF